MRTAALLGLCLTSLSISACATESGRQPEARSLLGQSLYAPPIADDHCGGASPVVGPARVPRVAASSADGDVGAAAPRPYTTR